MFTKPLEGGSSPGATLRSFLTVLHEMLTKPLEGGSVDWSVQANAFKEETAVMRKYRKKRKHKRFFTISGFHAEHFIEEDLRAVIANISVVADRTAARASLLESGIVNEVIPGMVYSFQALSVAFCEMLVEEIHAFYSTGLPAKRPNSMNNYGIILNEIGLEPLMFAWK